MNKAEILYSNSKTPCKISILSSFIIFYVIRVKMMRMRNIDFHIDFLAVSPPVAGPRSDCGRCYCCGYCYFVPPFTSISSYRKYRPDNRQYTWPAVPGTRIIRLIKSQSICFARKTSLT